MKPSDFWNPFETVISSYEELESAINEILKKAKEKPNQRQYVWRGQVNADWAMHSSLYRRLSITNGNIPDEESLLEKEGQILANLHQWGLHNTANRGRLSILNQLAMLQHYGAPTRLIDVSFNAWVAVFFAVEQKWENGKPVNEDKDSRIFAIDATDRIVNEINEKRLWEDYLTRPWTDTHQITNKEWETSFFAWKPSNLDSRIFAQNGGFIFGGVPSTLKPNGKPLQFPKSPENRDGSWKIEEVRSACSVALRPHKFGAKKAKPNNACYTFRIKSNLKPEIRERLELMFGYKHSTIYPDYNGFSEFGIPELKRW